MLRAVFVFAVLALGACSDPNEAKIQRSLTADDIQIESPAADARITSPLTASGVADNSWYFEAVFPARLMARDGTMIAEAPAVAASDWMKEGDVRFNVEMAFTVTEETPATLVLQEDMPGENREPRQVRIPVILLPDGTQ
jgi:hypothetical protein